MPRVSPNSDGRTNVSRILLVSLDNLGDLVFASALVPPLRERYPHAAIDVWCKSYTADVGLLIPEVSSVIAADPFWDRAPGRGKGNLLAFVRAIVRVRRERFDIAILAAAPWRTAAAVAVTGIPVRIGLRRRKNRPFLTASLPPENRDASVLEELGRLLEPLGIARSALRYRLSPAPISHRIGRLRAKVGREYAAMHPFASKQDRCVTLAVWRAVAESLSRGGVGTLLIGTHRELAAARAAQMPESTVFLDSVSDGSLADTAAALAGAKMFLGHDSGPLHVAGAFGVPVVGVFAPGEPNRTFPQGVGPARMIARRSPSEISAKDILGAAWALLAR